MLKFLRVGDVIARHAIKCIAYFISFDSFFFAVRSFTHAIFDNWIRTTSAFLWTNLVRNVTFMCITHMTCLSFFWSFAWFIFTSSCMYPMPTSTRSGTFQQFPRIPVFCFGFTIWFRRISKHKLLTLLRDIQTGRKWPLSVRRSLIPFTIIIDTKSFSK